MRALLLLFSTYFLAITIFTEYSNLAPWNFYNVYTLIIIVSTNLLLLYGNYRDQTLSTPTKKKFVTTRNLLLLLIITALWFGIRYNAFTHGLIWFDEATQYIPYWSLYSSIDSVNYAAMQQQMPLDYYTSYAFLKLFGANVNAMLFHSKLYGIVSCFVLFQIFLNLRLNWKIILIGFCIFLSQATILRYSSEARPISLMIFLGLINLYYFYDFFRAEKPNIYFGLLPSSLLFALSTGLQPIIQLFLLTYIFKIQSENLNEKRLLDKNFILSILTASPLIWNIYQQTAGITPNFRSQNIISTLYDLFKNMNFSHLEVFFDQLNHRLIILILFGILYFSAKAVKSQNSIYYKSFWLYFFLFPMFLIWIWSIMDWPLYPHYFVIWTVTLIVFCSDRFNIGLYLVNRNSNYILKSAIYSLFLFLLISYVSVQMKAYSVSKNQPDLRNLFKYENTDTHTVYLHFPFLHLDDSGLNLDYLGPFYTTEKRTFMSYRYKNIFQNKQKLIRPDLINLFNQPDENKINTVDLFVISYCGIYENNPFCNLELLNLKIGDISPEIVNFNNYKILIYRNQNNLFLRFHEIFSFIENNLNNSPWLLKYYQLKMRYHMELHEYALAKQSISKILEIFKTTEFNNYLHKEEIIKNVMNVQATIDSN